ncbi:hypothetical protein QQP08_011165 [Theobroma cacao]|nr:hypothetical protein QQP08_011165 [Theobroma cacao]
MSCTAERINLLPPEQWIYSPDIAVRNRVKMITDLTDKSQMMEYCFAADDAEKPLGRLLIAQHYTCPYCFDSSLFPDILVCNMYGSSTPEKDTRVQVT